MKSYHSRKAKKDKEYLMKEIKPYHKSEDGKKEQIRTMFDNVSGNYDRLNRLITFGMDLKWRKNVLKILQKADPSNILDIATGTGDMAILYSKTNAKQIVGVDISTGMLDVARTKVTQRKLNDLIELKVGDAENLEFEDNSFEAVTISYGIRNFENLRKGMSEILRVLKPKGTLVVLETSVPENFILRQGFLFYNRLILPLWGKLFSKDKKAYSYLSDSSLHFPYGKELKKIFEEIGFVEVKVMPQMGGISSIYSASKN